MPSDGVMSQMIMEMVLLQLFLTVGNVLLSANNYKNRKHKSAIFSGFAAGICFGGLIYAFINIE